MRSLVFSYVHLPVVMIPAAIGDNGRGPGSRTGPVAVVGPQGVGALERPGSGRRAGSGCLDTNQATETLPEACGQQAVDEWVDGRAEVEEDPREDVDVLEGGVHGICPLRDRAPQQTVHMEGGPTDGKHHHHYSYGGRGYLS